MAKKINARRAGNQYERDIVKMLKEVFPAYDFTTARYSSRELDDAGVDIAGTQSLGINIQAKRYKNTPPLFKTLDKMPTDTDCMNVIFWKKPNVGQLAILSLEDFMSMWSALVYSIETDALQDILTSFLLWMDIERGEAEETVNQFIQELNAETK